MFNLTDLWKHLNVPGIIAKIQGAGDVLQYALPWAAIAAIAFTGKAELAWAWLYGCAGAAIIAHVMKVYFNKTTLGARPNGGKNSFPSGHTTGAFSGAMVFLMVFGWFWAIIPFALAVLTGVSRVLSKNHWWRDVIAGAALGSACVALSFIFA